jgi:hypothetical protein
MSHKCNAIQDYFKLLKLSFADSDTALLFFMSKLFEDNHANFNNTPPREPYKILQDNIFQRHEFDTFQSKQNRQKLQQLGSITIGIKFIKEVSFVFTRQEVC